MRFSGSKDSITRREFLKAIWHENNMEPIITKERCTGCGLCAIDCPTSALTILLRGEQDIYQLLFRHDLCNACAICEKSCPENCLDLERVLESDGIGKKAVIIFEDKIASCSGCGIPLFPQAMITNLESKIFGTGVPTWLFNLCPSCRIKTQFGRKGVGKSKT